MATWTTYENLSDEVKKYLEEVKGIKTAEDFGAQNIENLEAGYTSYLADQENAGTENEPTPENAPADENEQTGGFTMSSEGQEDDDWRKRKTEMWRLWAAENNQESDINNLDNGALGVNVHDDDGQCDLVYNNEFDVDVKCNPENEHNAKYLEQLMKDASENGIDTINLKEGNSEEFNKALIKAAEKFDMKILVNGQEYEGEQERSDSQQQEGDGQETPAEDRIASARRRRGIEAIHAEGGRVAETQRPQEGVDYSSFKPVLGNRDGGRS